MNRYEYLPEVDDMCVTTLQNAFINHYMINARGDYVKVYIYGLKFCFASSPPFPTNKQIAACLKLTESDVINAWKYWENEDIINIISDGNDQIIEYKNLVSKLFTGSRTRKAAPPKTKPKLEQMFAEIEEKLARLLTHKEKDCILDWIEEYKFSPQTCILIIEESLSREITEINYWNTVAADYSSKDVRTYDQALEYIRKRKSIWSDYKEIMNYLGFYRNPTQPEKDYMDKWRGVYGFDTETILKACAETASAVKPTFRQIDKILTAWHDKTEVPELSESRKAPQKKKPALDHDYDIEKIEEYLFGDW